MRSIDVFPIYTGNIVVINCIVLFFGRRTHATIGLQGTHPYGKGEVAIWVFGQNLRGRWGGGGKGETYDIINNLHADALLQYSITKTKNPTNI